MRQLMSEQDFADIRHLLPDSVLGLMQVAGEEHTFTLIRRFGGTNIPVGKNYQKSGKALHAMLAEEVGEEAALRIGAAYGSQRMVWIPKCEHATRELRDRFIRRRFDELTGAPDCTMASYAAVRLLAREHDLTERWVWAILKNTDQLPENSAQNSLF